MTNSANGRRGWTWRRTPAEPTAEAPSRPPADEEEQREARRREYAARELARRAVLASDEVTTVPEAVRLALRCKAQGSGWLNAKLRDESFGAVNYGPQPAGSGAAQRKGLINTYESALARQQLEAAHTAGDHRAFSELYRHLRETGQIRDAAVQWGFHDDDTLPGHALVALKLLAVSPHQTGWGDDDRPTTATIDMRLPNDLADELRAAPITDATFCRSLALEMFPEWIAPTYEAARRGGSEERGIQLEPLGPDPVVTINDTRGR